MRTASIITDLQMTSRSNSVAVMPANCNSDHVRVYSFAICHAVATSARQARICKPTASRPPPYGESRALHPQPPPSTRAPHVHVHSCSRAD